MPGNRTIFATLSRRWQLPDADTNLLINIHPGRYQLEPIANPLGHRNPWLVLKGTKIGMPEGAWMYWKNGSGDLRISINEE